MALDRAVGRFDPDLDRDAMALDLSVVWVDAEDAAGEVDADAPRAGLRAALVPVGVGQIGAGLAVHVAGDERDAALPVAPLALDLVVGREGRGADPELAHLQVAEAEVEDLVQVLLVVRDLGIGGAGEVGKEPVRAEHQEQRLVGPGPVGAADEAVERRGRR